MVSIEEAEKILGRKVTDKDEPLDSLIGVKAEAKPAKAEAKAEVPKKEAKTKKKK